MFKTSQDLEESNYIIKNIEQVKLITELAIAIEKLSKLNE